MADRNSFAAARRFSCVIWSAGLVSLAGPAFAHHGDAGRYEQTMTTITGTVVEFNFVNPHSQIVLEVVDEAGTAERWFVETSAPATLQRQGFTPDAVQVGDTITVDGRRRRNGEPYLTITGGATVYDAEGTVLYRGN